MLCLLCLAVVHFDFLIFQAILTSRTSMLLEPERNLHDLMRAIKGKCLRGLKSYATWKGGGYSEEDLDLISPWRLAGIVLLYTCVGAFEMSQRVFTIMLDLVATPTSVFSVLFSST